MDAAASSASSDQEALRMNYDSSGRNSFKGFVKFHKIKNANFKKQYIIFQNILHMERGDKAHKSYTDGSL